MHSTDDIMCKLERVAGNKKCGAVASGDIYATRLRISLFCLIDVSSHDQRGLNGGEAGLFKSLWLLYGIVMLTRV